MYLNGQSRIITVKIGLYFQIKKGVRQGDPLSPILFNTALEEIFRNLEWKDKGLIINGKLI